jgi:regulator of sigma D
MKYLACFLLVLVTGCSSVPIAPKFPEVPERILQKCPQLEKLSEESKLSDITKTVTNNYTTYYECAVKHDAFIEWYQVQKKIYESVK